MLGFTIEGITGSGKSSILKHIHKRLCEERSANTKYFLSEHYTERALEHLQKAGSLTVEAVAEHVDGFLKQLETLQSIKRQSKFTGRKGNAEALVTIERFLLGTICSLEESETVRALIENSYQRIGELGLRNIILTMPEEKLPDLVLSTAECRNKKWCEYIQSLGTEQDIVEHFRLKQSQLMQYVHEHKASINPIIIEIKSANYEIYAKEIYGQIFSK